MEEEVGGPVGRGFRRGYGVAAAVGELELVVSAVGGVSPSGDELVGLDLVDGEGQGAAFQP